MNFLIKNARKVILKISNYLFWRKIINLPIYPKAIFFRLTNKCNLGCVFCMNVKNRAESMKFKDMKYSDFEKMLPELKLFNPQILLTGGEPFLNKDLFKIIRLLRSNNLSVDIFTNGYFIKENIDEIINSGIERIHVSLDHYKDSKHDKLRRKKGVFFKVYSGLLLLKKAIDKNKINLKIVISTTISNENYSDLINFFNFLNKENLAHTWHLRHLYFYNKNILDSNKKINEYYIENIVGQFIKKKNYFSEKQIKILDEQLKFIKKNKSKMGVYMRAGINKLIYPYYKGELIKRSNQICAEAATRVYVKNERIYTTCGFDIGALKKSIFMAWNSKKNRDFQKHITNKQLPQCFRCCGNDYGKSCNRWSY